MAAQTPSAGYSGVSSNSSNYTLQIPDIARKIMYENPYGHPFLFLLDRTSQVTKNEKFQVLSSSMAVIQVTQTSTNSNTAAAITATYDSAYDAVIRKNDVFRVVTANSAGTTLEDQLLLATANGSSGSVAMTILGYSSGTYTFTAADVLVKVGTGFSEESSDVDEVSQTVTSNYNYVVDHRTPFTVTDRAMGTDFYFEEGQWKYQEKEAMRRHILGKEMALLFGKRSLTANGNYSRTTTGGLYDLVKNVYSGTIALTKAQFTESTFLGSTSQTAFGTSDYSKTTNDRLLACSSKFKSKVYQMMRDSIVPSEFNLPEYGLQIDKIKADFGTWNLMHWPLLDYKEVGTSAEGLAFSLDMDNIKLRHMEKGGVSLADVVDTNIQTNSATIRTDRFRSVFGLHMDLGANNKLITISA